MRPCEPADDPQTDVTCRSRNRVNGVKRKTDDDFKEDQKKFKQEEKNGNICSEFLENKSTIKPLKPKRGRPPKKRAEPLQQQGAAANMEKKPDALLPVDKVDDVGFLPTDTAAYFSIFDKSKTEIRSPSPKRIGRPRKQKMETGQTKDSKDKLEQLQSTDPPENDRRPALKKHKKDQVALVPASCDQVENSPHTGCGYFSIFDRSKSEICSSPPLEQIDRLPKQFMVSKPRGRPRKHKAEEIQSNDPPSSTSVKSDLTNTKEEKILVSVDLDQEDSLPRKDGGYFRIFDKSKTSDKSELDIPSPPLKQIGRPLKEKPKPDQSKDINRREKSQKEKCESVKSKRCLESTEECLSHIEIIEVKDKPESVVDIVENDSLRVSGVFFSIFDKKNTGSNSPPQNQLGSSSNPKPESMLSKNSKRVDRPTKRNSEPVKSKASPKSTEDMSAFTKMKEPKKKPRTIGSKDLFEHDSLTETDGDSSIFDKSKSDVLSEPLRRSSRPRKQRVELVDTEDDVSSSEPNTKRKEPKTKEKINDDNLTETDNSYFSIFGKTKSDTKSEPLRRSGRPRKQRSELVEPVNDSSSSEVKSTSTRTKKRKKDLKTCISVDLADDDDDDLPPKDVEVRVIPEFTFISSFVEHELPLTTLANHVGQIEANYEETPVSYILKSVSGSPSPEVIISGAHDMRSVNGYYSIIHEKELVTDAPTEQQLSDDHRIWVDKYKPKCSRDIAGHSTEVEILATWLSEWKQKLKPSGNNSENSNSGFSYDASDDEVGILKCVVLTGRCGTGKTSAVYAIARELGFKVFEVSPSSSRVGRHLLQQLQEATLSHHVQGIPNMSPFFRNFIKIAPNDGGNNTSAQSTKTKKAVKPKPGAITNFFKKNSSPEDSPSPKPEAKVSKKTSLLNFFKPENKEGDTSVQSRIGDEENEIMNSPSDEKNKGDININMEETGIVKKKERRKNRRDVDVEIIYDVNSNSKSADDDTPSLSVTDENEIKIEQTNNNSVSEPSAGNEGKIKQKKGRKEKGCYEEEKNLNTKDVSVEQPSAPTPNDISECAMTPEMSRLKFCSLSIILFDDADISLEVDEGFWSSINSFLKVTRKPVILTASQNVKELCDNINSEVNVINFDNVHIASALVHLQEINKKEQLGLQGSNLILLFEHCNLDIRQSLLQLQFWGQAEKQIHKHSQMFGLPLPLLCLNSHISENILQWLFKLNSLQAVELVFSCFSYDLNILHHNMKLWLPFKQIQREETKIVSKPIRKYRRLDVSWFSDEGSDDDEGTSISKSSPQSDQENKNQNEVKDPNILQSLLCLSHLYDSFSEADLICKSACDFSDSFWHRDQPPLAKQPYSHDLSTEMASWVTLLSAKQCREKLETLPDNMICIYGEQGNALNIKQEKPSSNLVQCRQNIANSVLYSQRLNHFARCVDYMSLLRTVHKCETVRKECNTKRSRRFLHYFEASGFTVEKADLISISDAFC